MTKIAFVATRKNEDKSERELYEMDLLLRTLGFKRAFLDLTVGVVGGRSSPPTPVVTDRGAIADPGPDEYGDVLAVPLTNCAVRRNLGGVGAADVLRDAASDDAACEAIRALGFRVLFDPWMIADRTPVGASAP